MADLKKDIGANSTGMVELRQSRLSVFKQFAQRNLQAW
jgi:hypothetical protein